jgi:hypothetical protein
VLHGQHGRLQQAAVQHGQQGLVGQRLDVVVDVLENGQVGPQRFVQPFEEAGQRPIGPLLLPMVKQDRDDELRRLAVLRLLQHGAADVVQHLEDCGLVRRALVLEKEADVDILPSKRTHGEDHIGESLLELVADKRALLRPQRVQHEQAQHLGRQESLQVLRARAGSESSFLKKRSCDRISSFMGAR